MSLTIKIIDNNGAQTIGEYVISDTQVKALKHRLRGIQGILEWFHVGRIDGQVHKCIKQMRREWEPILLTENILPSKDDEIFINTVVARTDYKDRETREAEYEAEIERLKAEREEVIINIER